MSNINVFKLTSGEEVIAEVHKKLETHYELKSPATIMLQRTDQGVGVGLMPFMAYSDGKVKLMVSAIASEAEPDLKLKNEYNRIFGSGIIAAPASALASLKMP